MAMQFKTCGSQRQCFRISSPVGCNFKDVINVERNKVSYYNNARIIIIAYDRHYAEAILIAIAVSVKKTCARFDLQVL
jgi:hypothetical protein